MSADFNRTRCLLMEDPREEMRMQVSQAGFINITVQKYKMDLLTPPMNEKIESEACIVLENAIREKVCSNIEAERGRQK